MKKNLLTLLIIILSVIYGGNNLSAQNVAKSDGFFEFQNYEDEFYRDEYYGLTWGQMDLEVVQPGTAPAPVGNGLIILTIMGIAYFFIQKRRKMKTDVFAKTLVLLCITMLFTQCNPPTPEENDETEGITMTLNASFNNGKTDFNVNVPKWSKTKAETVYVVCNGKCIGSLTNASNIGTGTFTGTIANLSTGEYTFHYYYVGNQNIPTNATSFSMSISNQTGNKSDLGNFHIGYGVQEGLYVTSGQTVNGAEAEMSSLTAIGFIELNKIAENGDNVYIYGDNVNDKFTVDFSNNTPIFEQTDADTDNFISVGQMQQNRGYVYVMLLPNDGTETKITMVSKRTTAEITLDNGIKSNTFYCGGAANDPISYTAKTYYPGTIRGVFSVSATNKVQFSQGNLQADTEYAGPLPANKDYSYNKVLSWKFATNQYDMVGNNEANKTVGKEGSEGMFDLFGWSVIRTASDEITGNITKTRWGIHNCTNSGCYSSPTGFLDWGNNTISNGGNAANKWKTLSGNTGEWYYITDGRSSVQNRYLKAKVCNVNGIILLPDNFNLPSGLNMENLNTASTTYTNASVYDVEEWAKMEAAGAVFLPIGYTRSGSNVTSNNTTGYYRTSTQGSKYNYSYLVSISNTGMNPSYCTTTTWSNDNTKGFFVRLVKVI